MGGWYDRQGNGFAVFDPSLYSPTGTASAYDGFTWHKINSNIPLSGFSNRALFYAPRIGLAYDLFGTGNTVLRGGWGEFFYHNAQFTTGLDAPAGVQTQTLNNVTLAQIDQTNPGNGAIGTGGVTKGDNLVPKTYSYSFSVSQRVPGSALLELSYVGNQSSNGLNDGNVGSNINAVPYGSFLNIGSDPNNLSSAAYDAKRPFPLYQDLTVVNHRLYQNYNAFQASLVRTKGRYDYSLNYTYGKSMGVVGHDQLNLNNDYGPMGSDRRHIFNAAYSVELGSPFRNNMFAKGIANGWQLSGITQVQSGINLTANTGGNFNINTNGYKTAAGYTASSRSINGTDSVPLQPVLTCNPGSGLGKNQFVNPNCFAIPTTPGLNGGIVLPEVFGPAFFNSDLSLFKNFVFSESKKLQFRFST
ncbi:MAG TPA: carboxypeptidase regulatory-like domain-containing protein, partial [Solibacterales bacterium]|nr:carboxypeptidase regulatory-like domain-containing protein [Bryobacterales bacterium]